MKAFKRCWLLMIPWVSWFAAASPDPTYEEIVSLIRRHKLTTADQLLERLPVGFRSSFTLLHTARGLHEASAKSPRVLLFGKTARLVLAFNGHPDQIGYESIEAIQYHPANRAFEFHRIEFPRPGSKEAVRFSEKNPTLCLRCHQSDPRPNWDFYKTWYGAYGEEEDVPRAGELADFQAFQMKGMASGRYRHLLPIVGSPVSPYETQERGRLRFRPNLRLMVLLFGMNSERLLRLMQKSAKYHQIKYLFLLSRLNCDLGTIDPKKEIARLFGKAFSETPIHDWKSPTAESLYAYLIRGIGLSDADWGMSLGTGDENHGGWGPYSYFLGAARFDEEPMLQADGVAARMIESLLPAEPVFSPYVVRVPISEQRFVSDPLDLPWARRLDDQLKSIDFARLRGACSLLRERHTPRTLESLPRKQN